MHSHLLAKIRACLSTILQNLVVGGFWNWRQSYKYLSHVIKKR